MSTLHEPLVSFVVTSYNHAPYIAECLESILCQTATHDLEIVVVDDGSQDDTDRIVRGFHDPRVHYIRQPQNRGSIATLNAAFAQARGQFIARQDSDNRYRDHFLEQTLPRFEKFPQVGLVYGDVAEMNTHGEIQAEPWTGIRSRAIHHDQPFCGNEFAALLFEDFIPDVGMLGRRAAWARAFPLPTWFPRSFLFDDWFALLQMTREYDSYYTPQILTDYRLHGNNLHAQFHQDRMQEYAARRMLDELFAMATPDILALRRPVYARLYRYFGDRYFAERMYTTARQCYSKSFLYQLPGPPQHGSGHRWVGTFLGQARYEMLKMWFKRVGAA